MGVALTPQVAHPGPWAGGSGACSPSGSLRPFLGSSPALWHIRGLRRPEKWPLGRDGIMEAVSRGGGAQLGGCGVSSPGPPRPGPGGSAASRAPKRRTGCRPRTPRAPPWSGQRKAGRRLRSLGYGLRDPWRQPVAPRGTQGPPTRPAPSVCVSAQTPPGRLVPGAPDASASVPCGAGQAGHAATSSRGLPELPEHHRTRSLSHGPRLTVPCWKVGHPLPPPPPCTALGVTQVEVGVSWRPWSPRAGGGGGMCLPPGQGGAGCAPAPPRVPCPASLQAGAAWGQGG